MRALHSLSVLFSRNPRTIFRLLLLALFGVLGPAAASATTFTVTSTNSSGPGSLNQAILDANANPGLDTIAFNITGSGVHTIAVGDLPLITGPVLIDGYTQPGSSPNTLAVGDDAVLLIEIDGSGGTNAVFELNGPFGAGDSSGSTIRGLVINRLDVRNAISVGGGFANGSNNVTITGNFIGTDQTGMMALGVRIPVSAVSSAGLTIGGTAPAACSVTFSASTTTVAGTLNSAPSTVYDVDLFADPPCTSRRHEFLQGAIYLGHVSVTTDGAGNGAFNAVLPVAVAAGSRISATATDPAGETSELSQRIIFSVTPSSGRATPPDGLILFGMQFANPATDRRRPPCDRRLRPELEHHNGPLSVPLPGNRQRRHGERARRVGHSAARLRG